jgi:hypothetical protein
MALTVMGMGLPSRSTMQTTTQAKVTPVGINGYAIKLFATGTASYFNPDSIEVVGNYVFIDYQNNTAKDCTDGKSSTIVEYTMNGAVVATFTILGHSDGMRLNPSTHLLWVTSCEDANPRIVTLDPSNGVITPYVFPPTPHGGGYDDVGFINGKAFIAASNPTLNSVGVNTAPAVDEITLTNGQVVLTPILNGNATATDLVTNQQVTLNLTDPDSLAVDSQGNLVLVDQADAQLIFLHNPGTAQQTVSRLGIGTQVDDTIWIPAAQTVSNHSRMVIVDSAQNAIYTVTIHKTGFTPGTVYTEAPSDSGVAGFVGILHLTTGTITPVIIDLTSPTGLAFIAG